MGPWGARASGRWGPVAFAPPMCLFAPLWRTLAGLTVNREEQGNADQERVARPGCGRGA